MQNESFEGTIVAHILDKIFIKTYCFKKPYAE
jgi:hypothetical protein